MFGKLYHPCHTASELWTVWIVFCEKSIRKMIKYRSNPYWSRFIGLFVDVSPWCCRAAGLTGDSLPNCNVDHCSRCHSSGMVLKSSPCHGLVLRL
ncbi:hypothetical protein M378DRAFT_360055 [Amanita muscaria Koide BX008]|uniref:Uncharacterized protein n=1 Tax=Amanita muscaria (strain Koide BX008) TaxID=946122 RepID=A0A0C2S538_AMAMK|nr:hypothetical protein M378DRAFT_360055 [Amanita muscaria Koide BX008]